MQSSIEPMPHGVMATLLLQLGYGTCLQADDAFIMQDACRPKLGRKQGGHNVQLRMFGRIWVPVAQCCLPCSLGHCHGCRLVAGLHSRSRHVTALRIGALPA